jgi:hypothetical protein
MNERTYRDGYRDGWETVAGKEPMIGRMNYPPDDEARDYKAGFLYGRSEAEMHFKPSATNNPQPTSFKLHKRHR